MSEQKQMTVLETQGLAAKHAARVLAVAGADKKNEALYAICAALLERQEESRLDTLLPRAREHFNGEKES